MAKIKDASGARSYVWQLIKFRQRSEKEIRQRLKIKAYEACVIEEVVAYFKDLGYINDREFAGNWIESRLAKPLGFRVIRIELNKKGVSSEIIEELLNEKKQALNEAEIVQEAARKYYEKLKGRKESPQKIKPKLYAYLIRRGFSPDIISEVMSRIIKNDA